MRQDDETSERLARIEDFSIWLRQTAPGWTISLPEVQHSAAGTAYITFSLCREGLAVSLCDSPEDALAKMRDDRLFALYLQRAYGMLVLEKKGLNSAFNEAT
ncbi:hypothetical protein [Noviherbaspirillum aerium]|uniref:hypothetical protein n=1 Tax=Noviherbaspirillum aerium TaxID=2588497 RepID=UPI00124DAFDE|nr:hypothetical protein [Noviherbaspirillum aerium]